MNRREFIKGCFVVVPAAGLLPTNALLAALRMKVEAGALLDEEANWRCVLKTDLGDAPIYSNSPLQLFIPGVTSLVFSLTAVKQVQVRDAWIYARGYDDPIVLSRRPSTDASWLWPINLAVKDTLKLTYNVTTNVLPYSAERFVGRDMVSLDEVGGWPPRQLVL